MANLKRKAKDQEKIEQLRSCNDEYTEHAPLWDFYLSAYQGGPEFAKSTNIFKHIRETDADYKDRTSRIHNINYCEPLVDFFTNFIFSEVIERNGGTDSDFYNEFIKDVNKKGDTIDDFMRGVCDDTQIFGMSYILVDNPKVPENIITKADQLASGIRPYWVLVKPDEIRDWVVDEFGVFEYVKRCVIVRRKGLAGGVQIIEKYTEFYKDAFVVTEVDVTNPNEPVLLGSETQPNPLGEVPITVVRYKRNKRCPHMGLSFLRDFAFNNKEILNLTSLIQEFLYRQAFNILVMQGDNGLNMADQHEGTIGTSNLFIYPAGSTKAPEYISPPVDPAKFLQSERDRIQTSMFTRAAQDALSEMFEGGGVSGFSQAQQFSKTVPFISSRAEELEQAENKLMQLTMKWQNKEWKGKIKYKDRYELTNLTDAMTQFLTLARDLQIPSETFVKEELKRLVHEYDGKLSVEDKALVNKQIDEMDVKEWTEIQKEALVGKQGNSPGEQQAPKSSGTMEEVVKEGTKKTPNTASTNKVKK